MRSVAARTGRGSRRRFAAVGFGLLNSRATGCFCDDPEREAQDHHECGGRQYEE